MKSPKIRFKEFQNEWNSRILGEVCNKFDNLRIPIAENLRKKGNIPYYGANGIQDYVDGYTHDGEFVLIAEDGANDIKNYPVQYVNGKIWVNNHAHVLQGKNGILNNIFLNYSISSINFEPFLVGGGRAKLNASVMDNLTFRIPSDIKEQEKIGEFFRKIDGILDLENSRFKKLENFKKTMLDKLFVKDGADEPQIRLGSFKGEWNSRILGEVCNKFDNLRIPIAENLRKKGNIPYYGANGIQDYVDGYTHDGEFVLIAEDGANDIKNYPVQYVNGKIWVNNHAHVLQGKNGILNNIFLNYSISSINFEPFLVGGGRAKLNASVMDNLTFRIPSDIKEQEKIGEFFRKIDGILEFSQKKITKLENIKKYLLNKMFV